MTKNDILRMVFESALKVHQEFDPGPLENECEECLFYELKKQEPF